MTRALVTSSKYSPGNMTPEALEALFVGREKTLKDALQRVAASATGAGKHFILLVGSRGVGKTHLIALLHHRLMTDPQYEAARKKLRIAYLNEEEWGVASFLDLLVRVLNALASSYGDKDLEVQIERIYEAHEKSPSIALELGQEILIRYVAEHTLLLICENLSDLFEGLGEEGQKRWRSFIQEHPFWTILATTPALFAGVQLQTSPFYGFFTERHLEKLDFETAVRLLQKKAAIDKHHELAHILGTPTGRARVRAIHHLAGGNHRVYVTMSEFLDRESLDDLITPFLRMVDDLTPYYQDRMRQLAPQQRKLVEFLSRHEMPAMVKEIARRCLVSQQTAAKQLGELAKLGFVQAIRSGRFTYYELAEPLMRICVEVKDNKTQHLKLFVRFLREWFSARELISRFRDISSADVPARHVDRLHLGAALQEFVTHKDDPLLRALKEEGLRCFDRRDYKGQAEVFSRLSDETEDELAYVMSIAALRELRSIEEGLRRAEKAVARHPKSAILADEYANLLRLCGRYHEALAEIDRALSIKPNHGIYLCARGGILMLLERYEEVIANEDAALALDPTHTHSLEQKASALLALDRLAEAESVARALLKHKKHTKCAHDVLARALFGQRKYEEALVITKRALRLNPLSVRNLCFHGTVLEALGRYESVILNEDRLLAIDPTHSHAIYAKAKALASLGRFKEAESVALSFLEEVPDDPDGILLAAVAKTGTRGFKAGAEYLVASLSKVSTTVKRPAGQDFELAGVLALMMELIAIERGPLTMAEQIIDARSILGKPGLDELYPDALMRLLRSITGANLVGSSAWENAVRALSCALRDLPECELPLKMLGAAARYGRTQDVGDLLDLPLEQRSLLLDAFAEHSRPASPTVAVPASTSPAKGRPSSHARRPQGNRSRPRASAG